MGRRYVIHIITEDIPLRNGSDEEFMKKLSRFEWAVLALTAAFVLFAVGYAAAQEGSMQNWRVETDHSEDTDTPASDEADWPDSLLEGECIDLNTAPASDLERLPGIGPAKAQAIVEDRRKNGPYSAVDDLMRVDGIGVYTLERLRPYAAVS